MSLTMFSAVSRSISSAFFSPTAVWLATARSSSDVLVAEVTAAYEATEDAEALVACGQRGDQQAFALLGPRAPKPWGRRPRGA